jgi:hypothetical protein
VYYIVKGQYKSKLTQWAEQLKIKDWVLHNEYGLCVVLLAIPKPHQHIDFLLETKERGHLFWCTADDIKPAHKVRYVHKKKPKKRKPKRKPPGRKKLNVKVTEPRYGVPIYFDVDKTTEMAQFPCVIVSLVGQEPWKESRMTVTYEFIFSFLRHWYAKPIQAIYRVNETDRRRAETKAAKVVTQFIEEVLKERYY